MMCCSQMAEIRYVLRVTLSLCTWPLNSNLLIHGWVFLHFKHQCKHLLIFICSIDHVPHKVCQTWESYSHFGLKKILHRHVADYQPLHCCTILNSSSSYQPLHCCTILNSSSSYQPLHCCTILNSSSSYRPPSCFIHHWQTLFVHTLYSFLSTGLVCEVTKSHTAYFRGY